MITFSHQLKTAAQVSKVEMLESRRLMSVTYGANLILNPGAEDYDGDANGFNIITPAHWTANGNPTVVGYDSTYGNMVNVRKPDNGGNVFFAGGPDDRTDDFFQSIDLSSISAAIQAGQVSFTLVAAIGGNGTDNDNAKVSINFEDASQTLISQVSTADVSRGDRENRSKFIRRTRVGTVPADAQFAQIQIHFARDDGAYNDGYADNLSLVLATNTPSTVGVTPSILKSTLKSTVVSGQKINGALILNLANTSTSTNNGVVTTSLYASTNGVVDSNSALLGTIKHYFVLGANKNTRLNFPVRALSLPEETYTIFAQTHDALGTVVTTASGPSLTVEQPIISLNVSAVPISSVVVRNNLVTVFTFMVGNTGNIDSTGVATIVVGLEGTTGSFYAQTTFVKRVIVKAGKKPIAFRLKVSRGATIAEAAFTPAATFSQGGLTFTALAT